MDAPAIEIKCEWRTRKTPDGVNTERYEVCSDGKTEWETGIVGRTLVYVPQRINERTVAEDNQ